MGSSETPREYNAGMVEPHNHEQRFRLFEQSVEAGAFDQARVLAGLLEETDEFRDRVRQICRERIPAKTKA